MSDSIQIMPTMLVAERMQDLDERVLSVAFAPPVPVAQPLCRAEPGLWLASRWADHQAGEYWETLTYAALWLCGLISIGLCFF